MRRVAKVSLAVLMCVASLVTLTSTGLAAARIEGRVLDWRRNPVGNYPVHISGTRTYTTYTYPTTGVFSTVPETPGWYWVTVNSETRGPYYYEGLTGPTISTGDWILPQPKCKVPCEIDDGGSGGPTGSQVSGDDDMPNIRPGDDDSPNGGGDDISPGDDDCPNATGDDDCPNAIGRPQGPSPVLVIRGVGPNPFRSILRVQLAARPGAEIVGGVFDLRGRQIRTLSVTRSGEGLFATEWDGRDDAGVRATPGVYFVRAAGAGRRTGTAVVLLP